jgi:2-keto-4-pentenoate hydratase/2-oxohepta-3-ene-1,7-dioic acid hydratase in catechol pathway
MKYIKYNNKEIYPSKVICVGRNYVEHIEELNNDIPESIVIFNKPNSSITNELMLYNESIRYEGEICFLVKDATIEGVGFGLDLTKEKEQNRLKGKGLPWEKSKSFDNSAVFSQFISFNLKELEGLSMRLYINDVLVQEANYELMINKPLEIIEDIKSFMTLEDGDIIMTGTPKGVGNYKIGDKFYAQLFYNEKMILDEYFLVN